MIEIADYKHVILTITVCLPRMLTAFTVIPFLGGQVLNGLVRNSILLSFMLVLYPMLSPTIPADLELSFSLVIVLFKEIVIGMLIGFLAGILFWVAEGVGFFIDNQRGASMASTIAPTSGDQTTPLGSLLFQLITVLFFSSGGFLVFLSGLFESYRVWPVLTFFPSLDNDFALFFLHQADRLMLLVLLLSAPVIIAIFAAELGLGLINRFSPQLNVFFLSMPIKSGVASFILILYVTIFLGYFQGYLMENSQMFLFLEDLLK
jgi:type III secretion protein T